MKKEARSYSTDFKQEAVRRMAQITWGQVPMYPRQSMKRVQKEI